MKVMIMMIVMLAMSGCNTFRGILEDAGGAMDGANQRYSDRYLSPRIAD